MAGHPSAHVGRLRQIVAILMRHGLGFFVGIAGLERLAPFHRGLFGHPKRDTPYTRPEHLRLALGELGAAWIKLGQLLSTRGDLLPSEYQRELAQLQDAAPPVSEPAVAELIMTELGAPADAVFATFDHAPLAAASIGQAHAATRADGIEVVVKIRRPGVVEQVEEDLDILRRLAGAADHRWQPAAQYDLARLVEEFSQTLRAEMDYLQEGRNVERFSALFADDPALHIPRVFWETTTARVLTLERIRGIKIDDLAALDAAGIDRPALARQAARIVLTMVFEHGVFHADPHPGNFFIEPDGRIGLIDFGMVGTLDERTRELLADAMIALAGSDYEALVDSLLSLGVARQRADRDALARDLRRLLGQRLGVPLGEVAFGPLLTEALGMIRTHYLVMPPNLALLFKTIAMCEGLAAHLDPDFRLGAIIEPFGRDLIHRMYSPARIAGRLRRTGMEMARLGVDLPGQIRHIVAELDRGQLEVGVRPAGFEPVLQRLERLANRIILGIITAAFITGLAVLMTVYHPPGWEQWGGALFAAGFVAASGLGIFLAWTILRPPRR